MFVGLSSPSLVKGSRFFLGEYLLLKNTRYFRQKSVILDSAISSSSRVICLSTLNFVFWRSPATQYYWLCLHLAGNSTGRWLCWGSLRSGSKRWARSGRTETGLCARSMALSTHTWISQWWIPSSRKEKAYKYNSSKVPNSCPRRRCSSFRESQRGRWWRCFWVFHVGQYTYEISWKSIGKKRSSIEIGRDLTNLAKNEWMWLNKGQSFRKTSVERRGELVYFQKMIDLRQMRLFLKWYKQPRIFMFGQTCFAALATPISKSRMSAGILGCWLPLLPQRTSHKLPV